MSAVVQWLTSAEQEQRWTSDCIASAAPGVRMAVCQYTDVALLLPARQAADAELILRAQRLGLPCLRRNGGGAAVLVGPWMVSVHLWVCAHDVPSASLIKLREQFSRHHMRVLAALGVHAAPVAADAHSPGSDAWLKSVCFGQATTDELVNSQGQKIAGIAQHKARSGIWTGSGILVGECDWQLLAKALALPDTASAELVMRTAACGAPARSVLRAISDQLVQEFSIDNGTIKAS